MTLSILVLTRYQRLGSSSRVRFYQYFPFLQAHGVQLVSAPFFDDAYVRNLYKGQQASLSGVLLAYGQRLLALSRQNRVNLLWIEKELFPWLPAGLESLFQRHKVPWVVDYDDAMFHRYELHANPLIRTLLPRKIDRIMQQASLVIAGNAYLAERARHAGAQQVEILPSVVDVQAYAAKTVEADETFKIGWIGSPVTAPYLATIRESIAALHQESKLRMILVGAGSASPFPGVPTELLPWNETLELTVNQQFDVGIMPLVDGPFERGKCGYKLIQYMAGGLPVVASPVGVNTQIVEPHKNGFLAETGAEWLTALRTLRDHPDQRQAFGRASRQKAEAEYDLRVTAPQLLELLHAAARL